MPKEACRIRLEITDIRVERLQDISNKDCIAEGITISETGPGTLYYKEYAVLWDSINIKRASWKSNPWVWKISFKKL